MRSPDPVRCCGLLVLTALFIFGCSDEQNLLVNQIHVISGSEQCAPAGQEFKQELKIELLGSKTPSSLGSRGKLTPIAGVPIRFKVAPGSDLTPIPAQTISDAGGCATVKIIAGKKVGDQYLDIIPNECVEKTLRIRFVSGVELLGVGQEFQAGSTTSPVGVKLTDATGNPVVGVPVRFQMLSTIEESHASATINNPIVETNANGIANTPITLGKRTGKYQVGIEIIAPEQGFLVSSLSKPIFGFNLVGIVATLLGGLSFFLFGMKLMSEGFQKIAGNKMKNLLQFFTRNGITAVLTGTLATAVLQSSSATTVMVIGFINAGLLSLTQSIGIIFGANIGTTITSQIISFNLSGIALPAITLGFISMLFKRKKISGCGEAILGFGLVFFGMSMMGSELKSIGEFSSFREAFQQIDCSLVNGWMPPFPVICAIGIGIVATVLIQSSSATMGIILSLACSGLINFYTAVPLMIGTNIGTTVTAMLAATTANRIAKQAAMAHLMFNTFGALLMLILFYVPCGSTRIPVSLYFINQITPGDAFATIPQNIGQHIAMAHTFFNVVVAIVLMPFIQQLAQLCNRLLPISVDTRVKVTMLEPNLLSAPPIALRQASTAVKTMVQISWRMVDIAVTRHLLTGTVSKKRFEQLAQANDRINKMQNEISAYLMQLTHHPLTEQQSRLIPLLMRCAGDAEQIAAHTATIIQLTERLSTSEKKISEEGCKGLKKMWKALNDQRKTIIASLAGDNRKSIKAVQKKQRKFNQMLIQYENNHINRLRHGECSMEHGVIFIEVLRELEKIGEILSNLAERIPTIQKNCS